MKIVIDNKIPFIQGILEPYAQVVYLPGAAITSEDLQDADALIVRTRTACNEALLANSSVKIIVTATIGFDHIDTSYCESQGMVWKNAPGCNSGSVMQYLGAALAYYTQKNHLRFEDLTIGIVGVGHVGKKVAALCQSLGMRVLLNDPPREAVEGSDAFVSLSTLQEQADILTFHTPLQSAGDYPTYHLVEESFIASCMKRPLIINTCRGEVVDNRALNEALKQNIPLAGAVIDCWEGEPMIDLELMGRCFIATPHIAGYSYHGKSNGTSASVQALSRFFGWNLNDWKVPSLPLIDLPLPNPSSGSLQEIISRLILHTYPIFEDDVLLKGCPQDFEVQRGDYRRRLEFENYRVQLPASQAQLQLLCQKLGFKTT